MPAVKSVASRKKPSRRAATPANPSATSLSLEQSQVREIAPVGLPLIATALFLSGTAALIYQVLWIRQVSLVVGAEVYSITIAVAAFFAGLAAGSIVFGRTSDRYRRPLRLYAILEISTAIAGVGTTLLLPHAGGTFVLLQNHTGPMAWLLPFALVGIPACLMGGTLPVLICYVTKHQCGLPRAGSLLYAANTAGGIAGALASSFLLLRWLGVFTTALIAGCLNLIAAVIALALARSRTAEYSTRITKNAGPRANPRGTNTALALYTVAGAAALGYEVVWSQVIVPFTSTRVFAFSVVLATYLAGLATGSALHTRLARRPHNPWGIFALLISGAGAIALLEIAALGLWQLQVQYFLANIVFHLSNSEFARMCAMFAVAAFGLVFLPTILLGAAFPTVLHLAAEEEHAGRDSGRVLLLNTAGGIIGSLLTGFVLIPSMGLVRTLSILAVVASALGILAVLLGTNVRTKWKLCVAVIALIATVTGITTPQDRLARVLLLSRGGGQLIFYREGRGATIAVAQQQNGNHVFRRLYIQGISNSGDTLPSMRYMRLQALLPLLIHRGNPQSALVIGYGTGITAGATLRYTGLIQRVCVELLPDVIKAGVLFPENYGAGRDSHISIHINDGRQELLGSSATYDMITLEPPPPSAAGIVNLYSADFYKLAARRLAPDGLFAQWLPIATQNEEDTRALIRSFLDVFPYATLWTTELHEMLLIGSLSPIELDAARIEERFAQPKLAASLGAVGIASPAALLATWVTGREGLDSYTRNTRAVTDNHPRIEYSAWVHPREITRTLPHMLALKSKIPLQDASEGLRMQIQREQSTLAEFYVAALAAYNGNRQAWADAMQQVLAADNHNPYFNWFTRQ